MAYDWIARYDQLTIRYFLHTVQFWITLDFKYHFCRYRVRAWNIHVIRIQESSMKTFFSWIQSLYDRLIDLILSIRDIFHMMKIGFRSLEWGQKRQLAALLIIFSWSELIIMIGQHPSLRYCIIILLCTHKRLTKLFTTVRFQYCDINPNKIYR